MERKRVFELLGLLCFFVLYGVLFVSLSMLGHYGKRSRHPPPPPSPLPEPSLSPSPHVSFHRALLESNEHNFIFLNNNSSSSSSLKPLAIFVMGDSTVDCEENALFYPFFLAKKMGLPDTPTFYEQNGTIEGILNGLNYGSAHATILPSARTPTFQSLNQQLRQAFETIQLVQLQLGEQEAQRFISSSVFYLSLGKDDYINFLFDNSTFSSGYNGDAQLVPKLLVDEMTNAFRSLYDAGVRKIVCMGIYPLGCAPRTVVNWYFLTGRNSRRMRVCVNEINHLIAQHNQLLNDHIIDLTLEFSDAQFVFCDVYQGFMHILSNPHKYGFVDARGACCGRGWHGAASGCDAMEMACNQASAHVWWDFYNPSEAVNSLLADSAWSGEPLGDICHPLSIQGLVNAAS